MPPSMNPRVSHRPLRHRKRLRAKKNAVFWACSAGVSSNLRPNRKQSRFRRLCRFPRLPSAGTHAAAHRAAARGRPARKAECEADLLACVASAFTQLCASAPLYDAVYSHHTGADPAGASRTAANRACGTANICGSAGNFAATVAAPAQQPTQQTGAAVPPVQQPADQRLLPYRRVLPRRTGRSNAASRELAGNTAVIAANRF